MAKIKWYNWTGDAMWNEYCRVGGIIIAFCLVCMGLLIGASL